MFACSSCTVELRTENKRKQTADERKEDTFRTTPLPETTADFSVVCIGGTYDSCRGSRRCREGGWHYPSREGGTPCRDVSRTEGNSHRSFSVKKMDWSSGRSRGTGFGRDSSRSSEW